jgi:DNA-binding GntR family transcriptional regulator
MLVGVRKMVKPRYVSLAEELIRDIARGRFAVGASLPGEVEMSTQYGVSRATVRSALKRVQDLGLISRRKRAGIRVEAAKPRNTYQQSLSSIEDLIQFAAVTERKVQSVKEIECDEKQAFQLGCELGQRWLRVELLRVDPRSPKLPICWTDLYLDPLVGAAIRRDLRKSKGLICEMVESRFGRVVAEVRQEIRAIGVPERIAGPLAAQAGSHALEITRRYIDRRGETFEVTVGVFPADRYSYSFKLMRQPEM